MSEVFSFTINIAPESTTNEVLSAISQTVGKLDSLFRIRGGSGFRISDVAIDGFQSFEIKRHPQTRLLAPIILRLVVRDTEEDIEKIIADFREELAGDPEFLLEIDEDDAS